MEQKKKALLRRLTIFSIPFVFVAIPSIVIVVGMLSPHAGTSSNLAPGVAAQNHSMSMLSTMTGGQMILSCRSASSGSWEYFHYFILDPYKPQHAFFQPQADPYSIFCKWGYMGNFLQDVVVFNSSAPYAPQCRVESGGCRYLFQDGQMFLITGGARDRPAPAPGAVSSPEPQQLRPREKALVGDLLLRECKHVLWVFPTTCQEVPHQHQYVGKIIGRWRWWFNY